MNNLQLCYLWGITQRHFNAFYSKNKTFCHIITLYLSPKVSNKNMKCK